MNLYCEIPRNLSRSIWRILGVMYFQWNLSYREWRRLIWQIPLKLLHLHKPPDPETRIYRYKLKLNQHLNLNLYCEIPRNLGFSIWRILGVKHFHRNLSYRVWRRLICKIAHWICLTPKINPIAELRFLCISWYKFKLKIWSYLNVYRGIWVARFGGFEKCSIFSGNCHAESGEDSYGRFHWKRFTPTIHQIQKLDFSGIISN